MGVSELAANRETEAYGREMPKAILWLRPLEHLSGESVGWWAYEQRILDRVS